MLKNANVVREPRRTLRQKQSIPTRCYCRRTLRCMAARTQLIRVLTPMARGPGSKYGAPIMRIYLIQTTTRPATFAKHFASQTPRHAKLDVNAGFAIAGFLTDTDIEEPAQTESG